MAPLFNGARILRVLEYYITSRLNSKQFLRMIALKFHAFRHIRPFS
jgi:hypothetical protein